MVNKFFRYEKQKIWCAIRVSQSFSVDQLVDMCNASELKLNDLDPTETKHYVWALRRYGYLDWHKADKNHTKFTLVRDTGALAPETHGRGWRDLNIGSVQDVSQRFWNAICPLNEWDLPQLSSYAQLSLQSASRYTRLLVAAEYARCEARDRRIVGSRDRYQLIKKTGAIAPLFRDDGEIFDSNLFLQELWALQSKKSKRRARA